MGFGSYDESEQQEQTTDDEDVEAVNVHENDHQAKCRSSPTSRRTSWSISSGR